MKAAKKIIPFLLAVQMAVFALPITTLAEEQQQNAAENMYTDSTDMQQADDTEKITVSENDESLTQTGSTDETTVPENDEDLTQNGSTDETAMPGNNDDPMQTESTEKTASSDDANADALQGDENANISFYSLIVRQQSEDVYIDRISGVPEGLTRYSFYVKEVVSRLLGTDSSVVYDGKILYSPDNDSYSLVNWDDVITLDNTYTNYNNERYGNAYFIVGSNADDQLDNVSNVKYKVTVYFKLLEDELAFKAGYELYNSAQEKIPAYEEYTWNSTDSNGNRYYYKQCRISSDILSENEYPMMHITLPSEYASLSVSAYKGLIYDEAKLSSAVDITSEILGEGSSYQIKDAGSNSYGFFYADVTLAVTVNEGKRILIPIRYNVHKAQNSVSLYTSTDNKIINKNVYISLNHNGNRTWGNFDVYESKSFSNLNIKAYAEYKYFDDAYGGYKTDASKVKFACWGMYNTENEAISNGAENIKDTLMSGYYAPRATVDLTKCKEITGYLSDNTPIKLKEIYVTVIDQSGLAYHDVEYVGIIDRFQEGMWSQSSLSDDTYFNIRGVAADAEDSDNKRDMDFYRADRANDSYFRRGYQTVFILDDGKPVSEEEIYPVFTTGNGVRIRTLIDGVQSQDNQLSGVSPIKFDSGKAIHYAALSESGNTLKNYLVTFVTQTKGPKLFVNAANDLEHLSAIGNPQREVFLNSQYNYHHDIFFANIGDETLRGITVTLSDDAKGVKLDPYWTVVGTSVRTLNPFTKTGDDMDNIAKVRLIPDPDNEGAFESITGTLTISSDNGGSVDIELTGKAGVPRIITDDIFDGVQYVPYSCVIMTNSMDESDAMSFRISSGSLPEGITLRNNGELYGIPMEAGKFTFTVEAKYNGNTELNSREYTTYREYTINVKDNSDANVDAVNEDPQGYTLTNRVSKYVTVYYNGMNGNLPNVERIEVDSDLFRSEGSYSSEFIAFYIDGQKLTEGVDYTAEEGSTKITIQAQTFGHIGITGNDVPHTLAAEFRTDNKTNELKRSAQNVYLDYVKTKDDTTDDNHGVNPGGNAGGNNGGNSVLPSKSDNLNSSLNKESNESVTAFFTVVDANGEPVSNLSLELRSTPKYAETDSSGLVKFDSVEFGRHTLYIKNTASGEKISKSFKIESGSKTGIKKNVITAKANEPVFIKIKFDGENINFLTAEVEDVSAGASTYNDDETIKCISLGEEIVTLISVITAMMICFFCKSRKTSHKNNKNN